VVPSPATLCDRRGATSNSSRLGFGLLKDGKMKKQRFTEEQIIATLKEQETGAKVADPCR
jgi:hypothetical protein